MAEIAAPTPDDEQQNQPAAEGSIGDAASTTSPNGGDAPMGEADREEPSTVAEDNTVAEARTLGEDNALAEDNAVAPEASSMPAEPSLIVEPEPPAADPISEPEPIALAPIIEPTPEPTPAPTAPTAVSGEPTVASTIEVPASATAAADADGGEWALLQEKVGAWLNSGQLQQQWQAARQPLSLLAGLIALLLVVRIYSALLGVLEGLPLIPGLLELVGVIVVARFSLTRLVRSDERRSLLTGLQARWKAFRGKG